MGLSFEVYVGPFVRCEKRPGQRDSLWEMTEGRLHSIRDALAADDGGVVYAGPNVKMPNIKRQLSFERYQDMPVVFNLNQLDEIAAFVAQFESEIAKLRKAYASATVEWGVVPSLG